MNKNDNQDGQPTLIERMFERLLDLSPKFQEMKTSTSALITSVSKLAQTVLSLVQSVDAHQQAITDLYLIQDQMIKKLKSTSMDFPPASIDKDKLN